MSFEFVATASLPAPPEATEDRTEQLLAELVEGSTRLEQLQLLLSCDHGCPGKTGNTGTRWQTVKAR